MLGMMASLLFMADPLELFLFSYFNEILGIVIFVGIYFGWQLYASINSADGLEALHIVLTCTSAIGLVFILLFVISWTGIFGDRTETLRFVFLLVGAILCIGTPFGGHNPIELGIVKGLHAFVTWARK